MKGLIHADTKIVPARECDTKKLWSVSLIFATRIAFIIRTSSLETVLPIKDSLLMRVLSLRGLASTRAMMNLWKDMEHHESSNTTSHEKEVSSSQSGVLAEWANKQGKGDEFLLLVVEEKQDTMHPWWSLAPPSSHWPYFYGERKTACAKSHRQSLVIGRGHVTQSSVVDSEASARLPQEEPGRRTSRRQDAGRRKDEERPRQATRRLLVWHWRGGCISGRP